MESLIVLYKGRRGAGKTLTMVKDGYLYYKKGFKVYSNLKTTFSFQLNEDKIFNLIRTNIKDCVILFDEIQLYLDSRRSMSKLNIEFSGFIQQIRKRNIHLLATTQYSNTLDLRFRQHIDIIVYPSFIEKYPICEVVYIDITTIQDFVFNDERIKPKIAKVIFNPVPIFKMYNTKEIFQVNKDKIYIPNK